MYAGTGTPAFTAAPYTPAGSTSVLQGYTTVLAYSWGLSTSGTSLKTSKANFQDLSFTRYTDANSNMLMLALAKGTHFAILNLVVYQKSGANYVVFRTFQLSEVIVTSVSCGASFGEDSPTENVTLNVSHFLLICSITQEFSG